MKDIPGILLPLAKASELAPPAAASQPATPLVPDLSPAAATLLLTVTSAGLCVLVVWAAIRASRRGKLTLRNTPARPNTFGLLHFLALLGGMFVVTLIGQSVASALFGPTPKDGDWSGKAIVTAGLVNGPLQLALAMLLAKLTFRHGLRRGLGLTGRHWVYDSARAVLALLAVWPVCLLLALAREFLAPKEMLQPHVILRFISQATTPAAWRVLAVVLAAVVAPVVEEVLYRGLLQSAVRQWTGSPWAAILIAGGIFAASHFQYPHTIPALFALAIALGYNYERTGRLWAPILIHMLFNGLNLTVTLLSL